MNMPAVKRRMGIYQKHFKRPLDIILSLGALIALSPVMLITAALVSLKLGRPVLFKQNRPGLDEKLFKLYKFRTMTDARDAAGKLQPDTVRLTRFGKLLRATSLDELPELINILKGDMSIVGPRPLLVEYLPFYQDSERQRHAVRPGLTGLAQISGRNFIKWEEKFAKDVEYVANITLAGDMKIIAQTALQVLRRKNVSPDTSKAEGNLAEIRMRKG